MSTDIDPAFADRCAAAAINLRTLADLGESPDADPDPIARAAWLTEKLLADPEALLAVALVIEQQRALGPVGAPAPPCPAPPRADDLSTLRPGETRLVGGKMWARCKRCGFVGSLEGRGTWHVCDPVSPPPLGDWTP